MLQETSIELSAILIPLEVASPTKSSPLATSADVRQAVQAVRSARAMFSSPLQKVEAPATTRTDQVIPFQSPDLALSSVSSSQGVDPLLRDLLQRRPLCLRVASAAT